MIYFSFSLSRPPPFFQKLPEAITIFFPLPKISSPAHQPHFTPLNSALIFLCRRDHNNLFSFSVTGTKGKPEQLLTAIHPTLRKSTGPSATAPLSLPGRSDFQHLLRQPTLPSSSSATSHNSAAITGDPAAQTSAVPSTGGQQQRRSSTENQPPEEIAPP